ncbi:ATP-binding cassette domain-containing protein [Methylopila sp. Yamaguchi]|uniref:ATP-binding cassette domain-containing protein n=1 Tax=Methylopila sp. Yamaguchi TaxID=1437817 RepID=UPI000CB25DC3|nr:ATP-binding cassette domain-containing protein [Methylopila sp. Yamaguchi]GBD49000.1 ABC transporter [Methylopila sp. Yamaguchi]
MTARSLTARGPAAFSPIAQRQTSGTTRLGAGGKGATVTLRGLSKSFGVKPVLKNVDLHIPAGQFVAVVGKSGCGKSTLLRTILGLEAPTAGDVRVADAAPNVQAARIMFQEPRLLPWARVIDNVVVGVRNKSDKSAARAAAQNALDAAQNALDEVGLGDRGGDWPSALSGGQKQRVALARALVSHPRLLALDEPLGALDALTRIEMQGLVERIWREQGFTAVLVTHDVSEALALADRVVLVEDGAIALDLAVDLPRPRRRGSPELARLEGIILDQLFRTGDRVAAEAPADALQEAYA